MHAGDGNVHTNIPVNSDHYEMLQTAYGVVERIMALAKSLDGVVSGEHGIGITKLEFLTEDEIQPFRDYKARVDPEGRFNKGKLLPGRRPDQRLHALVLAARHRVADHGAVGDRQHLDDGQGLPALRQVQAGLLDACAARQPALLPRNKILATSLLIEAFLYEEQTRRGVSLQHFDEFNDVADHCTICHKCVTPCPVDIDFGNVSIRMRNLLRDRARRSSTPAKAAAMAFLTIKDPATIKLVRKLMIDWGYRAQRLGLPAGPFFSPGPGPDPATAGNPGHRPSARRSSTSSTSRCRPGCPGARPRALLDIEDDKIVPVIRDPKRVSAPDYDGDAVFYFPGCGSERLFSQVSLATQAILYEIGAQTVLPPGYLCCGYPQTAAGEADQGLRITTDNRVLFHRVANTLNYLDIKTVIVSCGTCMDQLEKYHFEQIFPGCRLLDIHEYLLEKGVRLDGVSGSRYLYHDPCHAPMRTMSAIKVVNQLMGQPVELSERCCGESGTLAVTRPDVSTQVRFRKQEEIENGAGRLRSDGFKGGVRLLTSCPSCLQGLSRYNDDAGTEADYIVVEMVRRLLGEQWLTQYVHRANNGGIERVLL
jgi:Fe-S oxidoreductase